MARKIIKLPSVSRVTPGSIATLELPIGPTYKRIFFAVSAASGLDATDIGRIDVLIDGKVVQTFKDLQRLMDLNGYYNRASDTMSATAAQFGIHFERAELADLTYQRAPGIGTADVQTFHLEMAIASGAPASIAITAYAEIDPLPQPLGVFVKVREFPFNSSVSGQVEVDKLPRGPWYQAIHLFKADISQVEVQANQTKIVDATKGILERSQKEAAPIKRVPVTAKATHIDMVTDGDLAQSIRTEALGDFRILMTLDTSGAVDIVAETLDTLAGV
jgi:hypothetical protein